MDDQLALKELQVQINLSDFIHVNNLQWVEQKFFEITESALLLSDVYETQDIYSANLGSKIGEN